MRKIAIFFRYLLVLVFLFSFFSFKNTTKEASAQTPLTFSHTYTAGWNLVSFPNATSLRVENIIPNFIEHASNFGRWERNNLSYYIYNIDAPEDYEDLTWKYGYWVYFLESTTITYLANTLPETNYYELPLAGWYTLGFGNARQPLANNPNFQVEDLDSNQTVNFDQAVQNGWIKLPLKTYKTPTYDEKYIGIGSGYDEVEVKPWIGYWMETLKNNLIIRITANPYKGVKLSKSAPLQAQSGEIITYEIAYENEMSLENSVLIEDSIPAGTTFISADDNIQPDSGQLRWDLGNLNSGDFGKKTFQVRIN